MGPVIKGLFVDVLLYCDELGLIGREMFAIDGCKISSNASKEWSGTREDFEKKKAKFTKLVDTLVAKHKEVDEGKQVLPPEVRAKEEKAIKALEEKIATLDEWLKTQKDKIGHTGLPKKSHLYDNESAKMVSSHGVVQGYNGVAAVDDAKHQVVVAAEAFGEGSEVKLLEPMVETVEKTFQASGGHEVAVKRGAVVGGQRVPQRSEHEDVAGQRDQRLRGGPEHAKTGPRVCDGEETRG
jgi:hypothetical protein